MSTKGLTIDSVTISGQEHPVKSKDDLRDLIGLMNIYLKWMPEDIAIVSNGTSGAKVNPFINRPAVGQRAVDYLHKAGAVLAGTTGASFSAGALYEAMIAEGWVTKSKRRGIALAQIRQLMKSDEKKFRQAGTGPNGEILWTYHPDGH
jgi:hypothetical protein